MSRKKSDAGYRAALAGAKGVVRLLLYICVIFVILLAAKTSYQFGHDVFAEEPVGLKGKGKEVTVQVRSGMEARELGELLKKTETDRRKTCWFLKSSTACRAITEASRTVPTC